MSKRYTGQSLTLGGRRGRCAWRAARISRPRRGSTGTGGSSWRCCGTPGCRGCCSGRRGWGRQAERVLQRLVDLGHGLGQVAVFSNFIEQRIVGNGLGNDQKLGLGLYFLLQALEPVAGRLDRKPQVIQLPLIFGEFRLLQVCQLLQGAQEIDSVPRLAFAANRSVLSNKKLSPQVGRCLGQLCSRGLYNALFGRFPACFPGGAALQSR